MTPGVNKPGGTGSVVKVNATTGAVDVRYMVEGYWERDINPVYIRPATLDLDRRRPTLGRCEHCGSLRVDCRQECDYFAAPPPRFSASYTDESDGEGGSAPSVPTKQRWRQRQRQRQHERLRENERRRRHSRHRRARSSEDSSDIGEGMGRHANSQRRRRHLPEDYDEEGEPVGGSSQEERESRSGSCSDSDAPSRGVGQQRGNRRLVSSSSASASGSDGGMTDSGGRSERSDLGNGLDSDVELLDVWRGTSRKSGRFSRSRSSSLSNGGGSETSEGDQDRELEEVGTRPPHHRRRGCIVPHGSIRGGGYDEDTSGGGAADARFLQPEGEEDELPLDIADPTRGLETREELEDKISGLLKELEGDDAAELQNDAENETGLEKFAAAVLG